MVIGGKGGGGEYPLRRVLILDDDSTTLLILSHTLQAQGLEVIACREIEAAEAILDHSRMDVVITDLCLSPMGGLDGTRLVRHVSTHFPEIDLFVMSAHVTDEIRRLMIAFGATAVLEKPVDPKILAMQVVRGQRASPVEGNIGVVYDVETLDDFLESNPIFAVLQPIVPLQDGGPVHGVESLARAPRESLLRNPELLFGYASRKERLYETDMICIRAALLEAVHLGAGPALFINVQPRSLTKPDFADRVSRMIREAGFTPADIVLELTEQETILNPRAFQSTLAEVRRRGFRVALDDYGIGLSNLRFLMEHTPDYVKISGHFCRGIDTDRAKREIVRSTGEMLRRLGIPGIMECVETADELRIVRELGIEFGQGYHFSRPLRARELIERGLVPAGDRTLARG
jgi:EAL domain-containing protein (putative c-di-GMP-specific phosphodiesterase class I)/ActR/RegA family two-component response regulator